MATVSIQMFPLGCVLFPGGLVSLRIFEPRYVDMVRRCLKTPEPFGVVAIRTGSEVGAASAYTTGTCADIVDWFREDNGLLGIQAAGRERFHIDRVARQKDGLYVADVRYLPAEPVLGVPEEMHFLAELLRRLLAAQDERAFAGEPDFANASSVGYRLAEMLPLPLPTKQELLEIELPLVRLERLAGLLERVKSEPF
jgi:uncharacterized protein